jgi:hypothetical protein
MVNEVLLNISQDDHERAKYLSRKKFLADEAHNLIVSRQEGIAIGETRGIAIGETRGIAIGETRGRAEAARAMLEKGLDVSFISEITKLTASEIVALKR